MRMEFGEWIKWHAARDNPARDPSHNDCRVSAPQTGEAQTVSAGAADSVASSMVDVSFERTRSADCR